MILFERKRVFRSMLALAAIGTVALGVGIWSALRVDDPVTAPPAEHIDFMGANYIIEPPDILFISLEKAVLKSSDPAGTSPGPKPPLPPINGEHLVQPDGYVDLGHFGKVQVDGCTVAEAQSRVNAQLEKVLEHAEASVSMFAYNSKVYYVLTQRDGGDYVSRMPCTGNETVLDALSQVPGLSQQSKKKIWVERPQAGQSRDVILPVNWNEIKDGAVTAVNYQILPGDRVFVRD